MSRIVAVSLAATLFLAACAGCHVNTDKHPDGKNNVDIGTPFGSVQVQSDNKANGAQTGLTPYPGASVVQKDKDDEGAADINMSFGSFKLGVHAVDLRTADPENKVVAFYRQDLSRYGDVLTCKGRVAIGTPTRTAHGLTCGSAQNQVDLNSDQMELRAGSEQHQHIVGIHTEDGSTRIGLVALDLPGGEHHHDAGDRE